MADSTLRRSTNAVPNFIQNLSPSKSAWRFVKAAFALSAPKPAFRHVLITLASYADENGCCFPSHDRLMSDTGYSTKTTVVNALAFWKKAGVLGWVKGWGNAHGRRSNRYQFNYDAMLALKKNNHSGCDEQPLSGDEQALAGDEQPLSLHEQPLIVQRTTTKQTTKVLPLEGPSNKNVQENRTGAVGQVLENVACGQNAPAPQVQQGEQSHSVLSSEQPFTGSSSPVALADLWGRLTLDNQKLWYRRSGGNAGYEGIRIASEILATQKGEQ